MLIAPLLLLFLTKGVFSTHYSLIGHWKEIKHHHIRGIENDHTFFKPHEERLFDKLKTELNHDLDEFFVDKFEIHGEDLGKPSAIFKSFLSSPLNREEIIQKITESGEILVFHMLKIDELPKRSVFIGSPKNGTFSCGSGIWMPNNTCACLPFYGGESCENILCQNGGLLNLETCSCPPGFTGRYCEPQACKPAPIGAFSEDQQDFVVMINTKSTMAYVLNTVLLQMGDILDQINRTTPNLYKSWTAIQYIDTGDVPVLIGVTAYEQSVFLNYLSGIHIQQGAEKQPTLWALDILQKVDISSSNIFVFTDSQDPTTDATNYTMNEDSLESSALIRHFNWRNKMMFFLSQPSSKPFDTNGEGYDVFKRLAEGLHGEVVSYDEREISNTMKLIPLYVKHETIGLLYSLFPSPSGQLFKVNADTADQIVTIIVTVDPGGTLPTVTNEIGKTEEIPLISGKRFALYQSKAVVFGQGLLINGNSSFSIRAFVHSPMTVFLSYNMDSLMDGGSLTCPAEFTPLIVGGLANSNAESLYLTFVDPNDGSQLSNASASQLRDGCTFTHTFGNPAHNCTPGPYAQQVTTGQNGSDTVFGLRIVPGLCMSSERHEYPEFECMHNQTLIGPDECDCGEYFEGPRCENIVCLNNGKVNQFPGNGQPYCLCKEGFGGDFCEILSCNSTSTDSFDVSKRTLSFVIQNSFSQAWINSQIIEGLGILLNETAPDAFKQFVLTSFNSVLKGGAYSDQKTTATYASSAIFQAAVQRVQYSPSNADTQATLDAVMNTVSSMKNVRSSIFLFVDAPFRQTDVDQNDVMKAIIESQHELNIIVTPPYGMLEECADGYAPYFTLAKMTGGIFVNLCNSYNGNYPTDPILQLLTGYGEIHHHLETMDQAVKSTTTTESTMSFQPYFENDAPLFLIVNSDRTENFTVTYDDGNGGRLVTSLVNMPFLSIYQLDQSPSNTGKYSVTVKGAIGTSDGYLMLRLGQKSDLSAFLSFATNPSIDSLLRSVPFGTAFYPAIHFAVPNTTDIKFDLTATDVEGVESLYFSESSDREDSCQYEKIFTNMFACDKVNDAWIMKLSVPLPSGQQLTRSLRSFCYFTKDEPCLHGGSFVNGSCECMANYRGSHCERPNCKFGDTNSDFQCTCWSGWTGEFCDQASCTTKDVWNSWQTRGSLLRQVIFVININQDQALVNQQISAIIMKTIMFLTFEGSQSSLLTLITFDENQVNNVITTDSDTDTFIKKMQTYLGTTTPTNGANTKAFEAIQMAYLANIDLPAIVYLFTGSEPASAPTSLPTLLQQRENTQINVFYTPQNVQYPQFPSSSNGLLLADVAKMSGGRFIPMGQQKISTMSYFLATSTGDNQLVINTGFENCSISQRFGFYVEPNFEGLALLFQGIDVNQPGNVVVYDPNGNSVSVQKTTILSDNTVLALRIEAPDNPPSGEWHAEVKTSQGSCYAEVRVTSQTIVVPGFVSTLNDDTHIFIEPFSEYEDEFGGSTYIAFRVVDNVRKNRNENVTLTELNIFDTNPLKPWADEANQLHITINKRDPRTCSYQFISYESEFSTTQYQKMVIYGENEQGNVFQRTIFFNVPQKSDSDSTCVHGTRNNFGECQCDKDHFGDYCIDRVCQNGGYTTYGGICACQHGYYGDLCENFLRGDEL